MRLAFSVAINVDAEILLIDEILAVGDQHFQEKCFDKLKELKDSGKTIVIVTHSLGVVKDLCHRVVWIYKGEFRLDGDPTYVIDEYLKQVAEDHKEERRRKINSGEQEAKAVVFIDSPKDVSKYDRSADVTICNGWQISDSEKAKLKIYIDGKEIVEKIERTSRQDVYDAYFDQYAGFIEADKIGWKFPINLKDLSIGKHTLLVECNENNRVLASKEIEFEIVEKV